MNEEYLQGAFESFGGATELKVDFKTWVNKIKDNEEYKQGMYNHFGGRDELGADYETWNDRVFVNSPYKKKKEYNAQNLLFLDSKDDTTSSTVPSEPTEVTESSSVSDQQMPAFTPELKQSLIKSLKDAGLTDEQIKLQAQIQQQAPQDEMFETVKFEKETYTDQEKGSVAPKQVDISVEDLKAPKSLDIQARKKNLDTYKSLLDNKKITQQEYDDVEKTLSKPIQDDLQKFDEIKNNYDAQKMQELTNKFRSAGALTNDELISIDKEIDRKRSGDFTFFEKAKIKLGFESPTALRKITASDRETIVQNTIKQKQADFVKGLDNDERLLFESYLVAKNEKLSEESKQAENFNQNIVSVLVPQEIEQIKTIDSQLQAISNSDQINTAQGIKKYNDLLTQRQQKEASVNSLGEQYEANRKTMIDNQNDLMRFDSELDVAKRDYTFYANRVKAIDRGLQYMAENALAFSGNTLTTIAKEINTARPLVDDENLNKALNMFNAWQMNISEVKDKYSQSIAERKSINDVSGIGDFGTYVGDLFTDQIPILASMYALGGAGTVGLGLSTGGERAGELLRQVKKGEKNYTQSQIIGNGLLYAAGEFVGEKITLGIMNDYRRMLNTVKKSGATKTTFRDAVKKHVKGTLKGLSTANEEGLSEVYTEFIQLAADNAQLDEDRTSNFYESYIGGFVMGKGFHVAGTVPNMILGSYSKTDNKQKVKDITTKVNQLEKVVADGNVEENLKETYKKQINNLTNQSEKVIANSVENLQYLDGNQLNEITSVNKKTKEVQRSLEKENTPETTAVLKQTLNELNKRKDEILDNPMQDSSFDKSKTKASKETINVVDGLGVLKDISNQDGKSIKVINENANMTINENADGNIVLESLYVPINKTVQDAGQVLDLLTERADEQGKKIVVNNLDADLKKVYEDKGFVIENDTAVREVKESADFAGIDAVLAQEQQASPTPAQEATINTDQNTYEVSVKDGELQVQTETGNKDIDSNEQAKVESQYIKNYNFDAGQKAVIENKDNLNATQKAQLVAEQSQNPLQIANEILELQKTQNNAQQPTAEIQTLKNKFQELTDLKASDKILQEVVANNISKTETQQEVNQNQDALFQLKSKEAKLKGKELGTLVRRLKKTGLADDVVIVSKADVQSVLKENTGKTITQTPNGFVIGKVVYLNRDKVKKDTPIHEFGHLWNAYAKKNFPEVYKRGLDLIKRTQYYRIVNKKDAYKNLTEEQKLDEALSQAIGEKGVKILDESKKAKFNKWFKDLFTRIAKGLGIRSLSADRLSKLSIDQFTDLVSGELLSGKQIVKNKNLKTEKQTKAELSQIDVVVAEAAAAKKARAKLRQILKKQNEFSKSLQNQAINYVKTQLDRKLVDQASKRDITKLLTQIKNVKTKNNLDKALAEVDEIILGLENKLIRKQIDKILDKNFSIKQSGRRKANLTTEQVGKLLTGVKEIINTKPPKSDTSSETKKDRINNMISDLAGKRDQITNENALSDNQEMSEKNMLELQQLDLSLQILSAQVAQTEATANSYLTEAYKDIKEIYENGRSELIEMKEKNEALLNESLQKALEDVDPKNERFNLLKTEKEIQKERKKFRNSFDRLLFQVFSGKVAGSLDSVMAIISRKGADARDDSHMVQLVNRLKRQETQKAVYIKQLNKKLNDARKKLFKSQFKADEILNKMQTIEVFRTPIGEDVNGVKKKVSLDYSNAELLNLWMNGKNDKLKAGLEANGFDQKVLDKVDEILPNSVKQYGEFLYQLYDEVYDLSNDVYKELNYHSMGKEDYYAGKVSREDVRTKEQDLKEVYGSSFSINTTGFGSQKERTANSKPIQINNVNQLINTAIQEAAHYAAYAKIHKEYTKIVTNKKFKTAINATNPKTADLVLQMLNYYKVRDLEGGGNRAIPIIDNIASAITKNALAIKPKLIISQALSFFNGIGAMPKGYYIWHYAKYLVKSVFNLNSLYKKSKYLQERYDFANIQKAVSTVQDSYKESELKFGSSTRRARLKYLKRNYNNILNKLMFNVKIGDALGVLGATPVYYAYLNKYKKEGLSPKEREAKALERFEAAVDRAQQTTSSFGKSPLQRDAVGKYFAMFATSPIQNINNANYHARELFRSFKKGNTSKGTALGNLGNFLNYQFAQPLLYTAAATVFSRLFWSDDEEDRDEAIKSALVSNYGAIPVFGGMVTFIVDKALGNEKSFGQFVQSAVYEKLNSYNKLIDKAVEAKTKEQRMYYIIKIGKETVALTSALPQYALDQPLFEFSKIFRNGDLDIWTNFYGRKDIDFWTKYYKALGYSDYAIDKKINKEYYTKENKRKEIKKDRSYDASKKRYKNSKRDPLEMFKKKKK